MDGDHGQPRDPGPVPPVAEHLYPTEPLPPIRPGRLRPAKTAPLPQTSPVTAAPPPRKATETKPGGTKAGGAKTGAARATAARAGGAVRTTGRAVARGSRTTWRVTRLLTQSGGAGDSGLSRVLELHLIASLADTLIVTALASTIFFAVPTAQARGRVATSLAITMVPFILLAPVLGPALDRVRRGRRYALATTMVVRAFLAWVMAGAVAGSNGSDAAFALYPAAFGFLVCQKAYLVTRAAAVPRVLPPGSNLVKGNSRVSMSGVVAMTIGGPLGVGITHWFGPEWTLRLAFVIFAGGTALALALPARIDSNEGEEDARIGALGGTGGVRTGKPGGKRGAQSTGPRVVLGLRVNAVMRALSGFLTLFLAFRLRTSPLPGLSDTTSVALVVVLAAIGSGVGTGLGGTVRRVRPEVVEVGLLALTALVAVWSAVGYGLWPVAAVCLISGIAQSLGKLCLDAMIQDDVPEHVRTSAFARSETVLQLAWVLGGGLGLALPLSGAWGLGVAAAGTVAMTGVTGVSLARLARRDTHTGAASAT